MSRIEVLKKAVVAVAIIAGGGGVSCASDGSLSTGQ